MLGSRRASSWTRSMLFERTLVVLARSWSAWTSCILARAFAHRERIWSTPSIILVPTSLGCIFQSRQADIQRFIYEAYMFFALQGSVQPVHGFSRWDNLAASEVGRSENPLKDLQASRRSYFFWPGLIFAAGEIRCSFEVNFFSQLSLCHLMTTQRSGD